MGYSKDDGKEQQNDLVAVGDGADGVEEAGPEAGVRVDPEDVEGVEHDGEDPAEVGPGEHPLVAEAEHRRVLSDEPLALTVRAVLGAVDGGPERGRGQEARAAQRKGRRGWGIEEGQFWWPGKAEAVVVVEGRWRGGEVEAEVGRHGELGGQWWRWWWWEREAGG